MGAVAWFMVVTAAVATGWLPLLPAYGGHVPLDRSGDVIQARMASSHRDPVRALVEDCKLAMRLGICAASNGPALAKPSLDAPSQRVFVAGTGEVDAAAYDQLRRFGDQMCGEVERQCGGTSAPGADGKHTGWNSQACRVARALYAASAP